MELGLKQCKLALTPSLIKLILRYLSGQSIAKMVLAAAEITMVFLSFLFGLYWVSYWLALILSLPDLLESSGDIPTLKRPWGFAFTLTCLCNFCLYRISGAIHQWIDFLWQSYSHASKHPDLVIVIMADNLWQIWLYLEKQLWALNLRNAMDRSS